MKTSSSERGLDVPLALHFVRLQQHPGWQNPEYSHHQPKILRDTLHRGFKLAAIFNSGRENKIRPLSPANHKTSPKPRVMKDASLDGPEGQKCK